MLITQPWLVKDPPLLEIPSLKYEVLMKEIRSIIKQLSFMNELVEITFVVNIFKYCGHIFRTIIYTVIFILYKAFPSKFSYLIPDRSVGLAQPVFLLSKKEQILMKF